MYLNFISKYFILFMIYSFAGWVMETSWVSYCDKKIVDRGFLIGPYCPIYGCGAVLIILVLDKFAFNPVLLFIITVAICGLLEYSSSWLMEKVFKARWWDYSDEKFNINGRICLRNLIAFGIMGITVTYFINPILENALNYLSEEHLRGLSLILWTIFIIDLVLSTVVIYGFRKITEKVNIEEKMDNTEQITKMVRKQLSEKSIFHRRFLEAYPRLEAIKIKMREIKTKIEDVTNEAKDAVSEKVNDAKEVITEKTKEIKNNIEKGTKNAKTQIYLKKEYLAQKFKGKIEK